jgi:glycosyltransferase involved in cell wall biosynthesis
MAKLLIVTAIDVRNRRLAPNQRVHHVINGLAPRFEQTTVLYNSMAPFEKSLSPFQRLLALRDLEKSVVTQEGPVKYIEVHTNWFRFWHSPLHSVTGPALTTLHGFIKDRTVYDVAVASTPWSGITALQLKRLGRVRRVVYDDYDFFPGFYPNNGPVYEAINDMENRCITESDLVITVGEELARLRRTFTSVPVHVVENGYDDEVFRPRVEGYSGPPRLVYTGALEDWAGLDLVIRALPRLLATHPDVSLTIVGSGPHEQALKTLTKELKLERHVSFAGRVPYSDLPTFTGQASVGICTFKPSALTRYAFPLKVAEYVAMGLPVLGTDVGDIARVIQGSGAGLVTTGDPEHVAEQLRILLKPEVRAEASARARAYAPQLTWGCLLERQYNLIAEYCLGGHST